MTGTSAAQYLTEFDGGRRKGLNVVMLEAREACAGATGRVSTQGVIKSAIRSFCSFC